jgi:hypothetical protein
MTTTLFVTTLQSQSPFDGLVSWLSKRYGDELGLWLAKRAASAIRRTGIDPCMDNFRVCDEAIPTEVEEYENRRSNGCCGFCDVRFHHYKSDRHFRFGFNYGH